MIAEALPKKYPSRLTVVIILFLITAPLYGMAGYWGNFADSKWPVLLGELLLPVPAYLYLRFSHYNVRQIFRLHPVSRRLMFLSAGLAVALHIVVYEVDRLFNAMWEWLWRFLPAEFQLLAPERLQSQLESFLLAPQWHDWAIIILATVLIAGLFEEILFRGFVQSAFEQHHKISTAILLTAVIFAANHAVPWWFAQIFLLGAGLGWMAWRSDSIIPGAIVHGINNLFAVLFINFKIEPEWLLWQSAKPWLGEGHVHPIYLLAAGAILYIGYQWFNRFCEEETELATFLNTPL
jgi:membrane protease YdiL (CAAX protease family)